jgi:hypothetical protein
MHSTSFQLIGILGFQGILYSREEKKVFILAL